LIVPAVSPPSSLDSVLELVLLPPLPHAATPSVNASAASAAISTLSLF
jgi:hypothetical protein